MSIGETTTIRLTLARIRNTLHLDQLNQFHPDKDTELFISNNARPVVNTFFILVVNGLNQQWHARPAPILTPEDKDLPQRPPRIASCLTNHLRPIGSVL